MMWVSEAPATGIHFAYVTFGGITAGLGRFGKVPDRGVFLMPTTFVLLT